MLSEQNVIDTVRAAGLGNDSVVALVKKHNHVWRIESDGRAFYLKTFTKDWYRGDTVLHTRGCVDHEASAWGILAKHGLAVPRIVREEMTCDNPLGRPFILTEALKGRPLTDLLEGAGPRDFARMLRVVGEYLARMHAIEFRFPGYLAQGEGPSAPPDPNAWRHTIWVYEAFEQCALRQWESDASAVPAETIARAREFLARCAAAMRAEFEPPRFTHGDCHAHQFYLERREGSWSVTGVVDMEVSSAGEPGMDFSKMFEVFPAQVPAATRWWEPLFEGYGRTPSLELMKLRLAAAGLGADAFARIGYRPWPGTRSQVLAHTLDARAWSDLFDLRSLGADVE